MEINIRNWRRDDLSEIRRAWLLFCQNVARSDMTIRRDADSAMKRWLESRMLEDDAFGLVADAGDVVAGFLVAFVLAFTSLPLRISAHRGR